jgi:hypothetical protein
MSVRQGPADKNSEARRLAFATPTAASVIVTVLALLATAVLAGPGLLVRVGAAPSPSASGWVAPSSSPSEVSIAPVPTGTATATAAASPLITPESTGAPVPTVTPVPTPVSSAFLAPTARIGLKWSAGVVDDDDEVGWPGWERVDDIALFDGAHVAVGSVQRPDGWLEATFYMSEDGLDWIPTYQISTQGGPVPQRVLPVTGGVLAIDEQLAVCADGDEPCVDGAPALWWSDNLEWGWRNLADPTWDRAWDSAAINDVASGPGGIVAVGAGRGGTPVITFSADGTSWVRGSVPAVAGIATLRGVLAFGDGFVVVGSVRGSTSAASRPAAWSSQDGLSWVAARVDGQARVGAQLGAVAVGADGLFATGTATSSDADLRPPTHGWASVDGRSWRMVGELGIDLPDARIITSDGERIVALGRAAPDSYELAAWISTDGVTWHRLPFSGATDGLPLGATSITRADGTEEVLVGVAPISKAWLLPTGVIITRMSSLPQAGQTFWLGTFIGT